MARPTSDSHVALLRGINVGGKNKVPMTDLIALFEEAGCERVSTFIASGNVLFSASERIVKRLPVVLEAAIEGRFGFRVPVVLRSAAELRAVPATNPFLRAGADPAALHVAFLAAEPTPAAIAALDPRRSPPDEFVVRGREVFLKLPNGVARTKLSNAWFDVKLGTTSTVRNWRTVLKLVELT
jgi:uncharacterized protein (DUF1697 family)